MGDLAADKIPTNIIMKVFETKELAEAGDNKNALYVFDNGEGGTSQNSDPQVSNGSQYIFGTSNGSGNTDIRIEDSAALFGSRLKGKKVTYNGVVTTILGVDADGTGLDVEAITGWSSWQTKNYYIHSSGPFFLFQKYYYRIEATDPVSGFIIDWDDGEDNSPEKANRQTIELDSPQYYAITSHTYTKHDKFYPMVRTISPEGFYSKWYVSYDAVVADDLKSIETQTLVGGQNEFSIVSADLQQGANVFARMPEFSPANMPPIGVLKADRTSVFSGIDNSVIPDYDVSSMQPKAYCHISSSRTVDFTTGVEVIYRTELDKVLKETITPHTTAGDSDAEFPSGSVWIKELLSAKIVNMKETTTDGALLAADERIHIRIYNDHGSGAAGGTTDNVITTLSLGNPIQYKGRVGFSLLADGGQSQTRASNVSINKYWFESGKLEGTLRQEIALMHHSDAFGMSVDNFDQTIDSIALNYAFNDVYGSTINSDTQRFYDEEKLIRLQVEDTSATTRNDDASYYTGGVDVGVNTAEPVDASEIDIDIGAGSGLQAGDVISFESGAVEVRELLKIININSETQIRVEREFQGTTAETASSGADIYKLTDNGRQGDSLTRSFIEHWDRFSYADNLNRPSSLKTRALLLFGNSTTRAVSAPMTETWSDRLPHNSTNSGSTANNQGDVTGFGSGDDFLVFGGTQSTDSSVAAVDTIVHGGDHTTNTYTEVALSGGTGSGAEASVTVDGSGDVTVVSITAAGGGYTDGDTLTIDNATIGGAANATCDVNGVAEILNRAELTGSAGGGQENPGNFLLCCKSDRFNRIYFNIRNTEKTVHCNLQAWYTAAVSPSSSIYRWKPLPLIDGTSTAAANSSLHHAGSIMFDIPDDWVAIKSSNLEDSGDWPGPCSSSSGLGTGYESQDPQSTWTENMYGILFGIAVGSPGGAAKMSGIKCYSVIPYNNSHSQAIKIVDPHHTSLNAMAFAQNISFSREGKYSEITDTLGRTELRRIGASGGTVSFGGVELSGNYSTNKGALLRYQREGTPVYLDVERKNGDFIRIYGVIVSMSEDFPTGRALPKFGLNMKVEYVAEYDSNGLWISNGLMALGGEIIDEPKYIL